MGYSFNDYDAINDVVYYISQSTYLGFTVKLSRKNKEGNRSSFHNEYAYNSSYVGVNTAISIKRIFDYFLTIQNGYNRNIYLQIRPENMIMVQNCFSQASQYLYDESLWGMQNKRLIMKGQVQPIIIKDLPMQKWIMLEPTILSYEGEHYQRGIRMTLSEIGVFVDIPMNNFLGLLYTLNSFNMYQAAITVLSSLQVPYGTNLRSLTDETEFELPQEQPIAPAVAGTLPKRQPVLKNKSKSAFDTLDSM